LRVALLQIALTLSLAASANAQTQTSTLLSASPNPSTYGESVQLRAFVGSRNGGVAQGTVSFSDGETIIGSAPLRAQGASQATIATSCALTNTGGVKCWGENMDGDVGDGTRINRLVPVSVVGLSGGVQAVSASQNHSCALTIAGGVKCWGRNSEGQVGDGTREMRESPVDVFGLTSGVLAVNANVLHTCAVTVSGGAKCWGQNTAGGLGDGTTLERTTPVDVKGLSAGVQSIAVGGGHSCALMVTGGAKCWGQNYYGELGDGTNVQRLTPVNVAGLGNGVRAITASSEFSCALTVQGGVKCWGNNEHGQLGDGTTTRRRTPTDVLGLTSGVQAIAAAGLSTCALTAGGGVKCWGDNEFGQLGDGTTTTRLAPVNVVGLGMGIQAIAGAGYNNCALATNAQLRCWGRNDDGHLGDGTAIARLTPSTVKSLIGQVRTQAYLVARRLPAGFRVIRANYIGSLVFVGSTSRPLGQRITRAPTQIIVQSSPRPALFGRPISLAARVTSSAGAPGGEVSFLVNGRFHGKAAIASGIARLSVPSLPVGQHRIRATFLGNANHMSSNAAEIQQVVLKAKTSSYLASENNPSTVGETVNLIANVTSLSGIPGGTVSLYRNGVLLRTARLVNGQAQFFISTLGIGTHSLRVTYSQTNNYAASWSGLVQQTVEAPMATFVRRRDQLER
jgi:alpha-tubulin suppressor-like RCC1 family protein